MIRFSGKRPIGITFGDSITEQGYSGWVAGLCYYFSRKVDIVNRGYSGYNTENAKEICEKVFEEFKNKEVLFVTICFGANDAALPPGKSSQYVPHEKFKKNLGDIIDTIQNLLPKTKILLISPPPIANELLYRTFVNPNPKAPIQPQLLARTNENTKTYAEAVKEVSGEKDVIFVDMYEAVVNEAKNSKNPLESYFSDGIHFNAEGNDLFLNEIINALEKRSLGSSKDFFPTANRSLPYDFPPWESFDECMAKRG